ALSDRAPRLASDAPARTPTLPGVLRRSREVHIRREAESRRRWRDCKAESRAPAPAALQGFRDGPSGGEPRVRRLPLGRRWSVFSSALSFPAYWTPIPPVRGASTLRWAARSLQPSARVAR